MIRPATTALVALFLSLIVPPIAHGQIVQQPYVWKHVKVGGGGFIPGIVFSPLEKNLAYCRTDIGGAYRWDESTKKWMSLIDPVNISNFFGAESIVPDPVDPNRVYMAAGMYRTAPAALFRSDNRGENWLIVETPFRMGGNEEGRGVGERLAVDPNNNNILYFASRYQGLWISENLGANWKKVESFPIAGGGSAVVAAGLSFVVFDPASGSRGNPTQTIFVGSTERKEGQSHLYRSVDAGKTWEAVPKQPVSLVPAHAAIDPAGMLYISYGNGVGPNGVTDGAVWKLNTKTETWTNITPDKSANHPQGGYGGLALDRQHPRTLAVTTMNRWNPGDTVWRSTDGGQTWKDIREKSVRDASATPFLFWGEEQPRLGWWMAALAIDPFDSDHICYATGATIWSTRDFSKVSNDQPTHWSVWTEGIEETAVLDLISPTDGKAHLISGFGDIGGFTHDDLTTSPAMGMHSNPIFTNTTMLDYAEIKPNVIVRTGTPRNQGPTMAWSEDGGHTWQPIRPPTSTPVARGRGVGGSVGLITSADGSTFMLVGGLVTATRNRGQTWTPPRDLPAGLRPIADRVNPAKFYALDAADQKIYISSDGGVSFTVKDAKGLIQPSAGRGGGGAAPRLLATLGKEGDLWYTARGALLHSSDGGANFAPVANAPTVTAISFGKAATGRNYPAIFIAGTWSGMTAIWRSDDIGATWLRVNDDQHQYGTRFRCISGDPRIYGRVYVGTDGRGIVYGDIAVVNAAP